MFHWISLRAFVYATEDRKKVVEALRNTGIEGELVIYEAEGGYGDPIEILEIKGGRRIDILFQKMNRSDILYILNSLEKRIDEGGVLHLRLNKQEMYMKSARTASGGDVISVEIKIGAYPSNRKRCIKIMREYLEEFL